jgi:CRISPR-associated protein Cas5t
MEFLEIKFEGWTSTPRMPFVLSGNALCMPTPSYSMILGLVGCCLGRIVTAEEVRIGFRYLYDSVETDMETRHRLEFDGKKIKSHSKGTDAYKREFHINPNLTIWLDRVDWLSNFEDPIGTPSLGRSQDILCIKEVKKITANKIEEAVLTGCMLPYSSDLKIGGQLIQLADSYTENEEIGGGRTPVNSRIFISVSNDRQVKVKLPNLYKADNDEHFYLHDWS